MGSTNLHRQFGARLRELRKARGLTQQALADRLTIAVDSISHLERGASAPRFETISAIAEGLDVEPFELFRFEQSDGKQKTVRQDAVARLLETIRNFDAAEIEQVTRVIASMVEFAAAARSRNS